MRVLLLEDDAELAAAVAAMLRHAGLAVDRAATLADADLAMSVNSYDTAVFDRMLPDGDAVDLVRRRRIGGWAVPVLFLTARDTVAVRVDGFDHGGDDYLVKPFAPQELVVRVRSLCRRSGATRAAVATLGDLTVDSARHEVRRGGVQLALTAKEFCVLELLVARADGVVSRTELIEHCWDELADPVSNVVDVVVAQLRRKLGEPTVVRTVRGVGFVVGPPAS